MTSYGQFTAQTKDFFITWDATPVKSPEDVVMGLSNGAAKNFSDMACLVRFADTGVVEARNGDTYAASTKVPYQANVAYFFRVVVRFSNKTYDVYIKPPDQAQIVLASNFAFRTEQAKVTQLNYLNKLIVSGDANCTNMSSPQPVIGPPTTDVPPPVTPPVTPPASGTFPTADSTGVPSGTTLTPSGSITVSTAGQTVSGLDITGTVTIKASNVTLQNCQIHTPSTTASFGIVVSSGTNILIKNCTIIGNGAGAANVFYGISLQTNAALTVDGCNFTYCGHSIVPYGGCGSPLIIQNCYMAKMINWSGTHYEHIYYGGGSVSGGAFSMMIQNNTLINENGWTATVFLKTDVGAIDSVTIQNNQLFGGGYTLYVQQTTHSITNVKVLNNAMGKGQYGYCYPGAAVAQWSGNYDYQTHAAVPVA